MNEPLGQTTGDTSPGDPAQAEAARRDAVARIQRNQRLSCRGLWNLALFFAVSIAAQQGPRMIPPIAASVRELLGAPPSPKMISGALILYSFSALVLILGRMATGTAKFSGLSHVGYLSAFYGFSYFSGVLDENFYAVFAAGLTILSLDAYHLQASCHELIRRDKQLILRLDRMREWRKGVS